jgi:predicted ATPase
MVIVELADIRKNVTVLQHVISGGGYHGKSTILNAIKAGIYNKVPGDGREFVVTCSSAVAIRSEDGRYVSGTFHIRVLTSYITSCYEICFNSFFFFAEKSELSLNELQG